MAYRRSRQAKRSRHCPEIPISVNEPCQVVTAATHDRVALWKLYDKALASLIRNRRQQRRDNATWAIWWSCIPLNLIDLSKEIVVDTSVSDRSKV